MFFLLIVFAYILCFFFCVCCGLPLLRTQTERIKPDMQYVDDTVGHWYLLICIGGFEVLFLLPQQCTS